MAMINSGGHITAVMQHRHNRWILRVISHKLIVPSFFFFFFSNYWYDIYRLNVMLDTA